MSSVAETPLLGRVWKVASRWSEEGHPDSSVLDLFRDHKVVFVGRTPDRFSQIEEGDLLVVSDGRKVVAMGSALSPPAPITTFPILLSKEERQRFHYEPWVLGCAIDWIDLREDDFVHYRSGAFHEVIENAEHYRGLYRQYAEKSLDEGGFEIHARSCTLARNDAAPTEILWRDSTRYVIPIFQRSYSWGKVEVSRLLNDLIDGFSGRRDGPKCEPMFIGTMQIEDRVRCDEDSFDWQHHVIDGQQRMSTLMLILRALDLTLNGGSASVSSSDTKRLFTKVGDGVQEEYLRETLEWDGISDFPQTELNRYYDNLVMIRENLASVPELAELEDRSVFADYLLSKVYFVVIETRAGLSKTLQIFKSINTTGLDLNGGDVFKIRFYEYLRSCGHGEEVFKEVAKLYDEIDARNNGAGWKVADMESILSIARHYVATEADLANSSRLYVGTTFFERFFDVVINKERHDGFAREKCESFKLTLDLIRELIDVRFHWDEPGCLPFGAEAKAMDQFIWWGRYGSYYEVLFLFCHRFQPTDSEIERFTIAFSKLLAAHSLIYVKLTESRKTFIHDLLKRFASGTEDTVDSITRHVDDLSVVCRDGVLWALENHQFAGMGTKNLACRLAAMLDEPNFQDGAADNLYALLFDTEIDIEHIEPCNHKDVTKREQIWRDWGAELHSLGNLIVLERSKNRGEVSNHAYSVKRAVYQKSDFATVRLLAENHEEWDIEKAKKRRLALAERIATYLCGPAPITPSAHHTQ